MVKCMSSRMDKYNKEDEQKQHVSRTTKNKNIYSDVGEEDYENLNLTNNISVIETDASDLDIDTIKDLLNKKYQSKNTRRNERLDFSDSFEDEANSVEEVTKEYDLKKVIETAHQNNPSNYDQDRFKKLRETQYDILSSLNIDKPEATHQESDLTDEEANLMNLIKTVNLNAEKVKMIKEAAESDDLLGDLLGDEKTEVLEPVEIDMTIVPDKKPSLAEEIEKTKQLSRKELDDEIDKYNDMIKEEKEDEDEDEDSDDESFENETVSKTEELSNSFYTGKLQINDKDMDDFSDLEKEMGGGLIIKILIGVVVLILLAVAVYFLNKYLHLGLF